MDINIFDAFHSTVVIFLIDAQIVSFLPKETVQLALCPFDMIPVVADGYFWLWYDKMLQAYLVHSTPRSGISLFSKNPDSFEWEIMLLSKISVLEGLNDIALLTASKSFWWARKIMIL